MSARVDDGSDIRSPLYYSRLYGSRFKRAALLNHRISVVSVADNPLPYHNPASFAYEIAISEHVCNSNGWTKRIWLSNCPNLVETKEKTCWKPTDYAVAEPRAVVNTRPSATANVRNGKT